MSSKHYTKITYEYALCFQMGEACHDAYNDMFINFSDINRYIVWDEAGLPMCVVDSVDQALATITLYSWSYLNGRDACILSAPVFTSNDQLEFVKDRIKIGELVGLKTRYKSNTVVYLIKQEDSFKPIGINKTNELLLEAKIQRSMVWK